ncbi:DUF6705 family protein [Formosa sp. Hel1_31_208]|uniref:DUF6705 family protein n=1 Tax=Formosa sp. Hel1_31_208 TaxID=1798225 RepID=UPI0012FD8E6F|nr:DUF6705 family protein [Formosa sp. Hel1_31_208]
MKKFIYILTITFLSLFSLQIQAQDIFIGTWEHQVGNEIFRVILWENGESDANGNIQISGHYEKVQVTSNGLGTLEQYIYCSDKEKFEGNNSGWLPFVIWLGGDNQSVGGTINDNTVDDSIYYHLKKGALTMEIITNSGGTVTASWKIERKSYQGVKMNEAPEFSVPTDVILTKVE